MLRWDLTKEVKHNISVYHKPNSTAFLILLEKSMKPILSFLPTYSQRGGMALYSLASNQENQLPFLELDLLD